jgi:hypothetical protein
MVGKKNNKNILNNTLLFIIKLLKNNNINNWFIGYGTLLGIIRGNECIEGDDDIDIVCDSIYYDKLKKLLIENDFKIEYGYGINNSRYILKTKETKEYCTIDFYMANVNKNGDFNDKWEKVIWSDCYKSNKLIEYKWKNEVLYIPNNYEKKLIGRYGINWKIPQDTKGPKPKKKIL